MTIIEREQILRVSQRRVHNAPDTALATQSITEVVSTVKGMRYLRHRYFKQLVRRPMGNKRYVENERTATDLNCAGIY